MSTADPPDQPPPYDDPEENDVNKTLQPTIYVLSGQSIHAESADAAPLYQLNRGVAKLTYATSEVELKRVDRAVKTDGYGEPTIRPRARHIYDLRYIKGIFGTPQSLPSDSPPFFVQAISRKELGHFALKKSHMRSHWKALPVDPTGKSSRYKLPAFRKDASTIFEIRRKNGRYEWTNPNGDAIAFEDGGEDQHRLIVTTPLPRETVDALVALWCSRLWQYSAENEEPIYSGMDGGKFTSPSRCLVVVYVADGALVRRKFALAKELPMTGKGGFYN